MSVIPALFRDAETNHPAVAQWCTAVLAGDTARLLLLGPHWSGKSHTAYAALRRLLTHGYAAADIAVHQAMELRGTYEPSMIEDAARVTVIDDVTLAVDLVREATAPREADSVDVQAMMALEAGALADAVDRLSQLPERSWILVVSSVERLVETVGEETTARLLANTEQAELPPRPRPRPSLSW
ncbi:hypothetical protein [Streptomyces sp. NPDC056191]|uniref:hypothetical protein n=1 Tax=Streptomyces sp. NPDC056191 TaxID=3345742 RepID=UPI0035E15B5E